MRVLLDARLQAHQIERGPPEKTVWIAERLRQFEMVVMLADQQPHLLAGSFDRRSEFAVLTLELGGLTGAVSDDQRRVQSVEMPYRAQRPDRRVVELDIVAACLECHRRKIIHAADAHSAFDDVSRQAELPRPIGRQRDRGKVSARGLATDIEPARVTAKLCGVRVHPTDRATNLIGEHDQPAADILHPGEVGNDVMRARDEEHLRRCGKILRAAAAPGAAVDEDEDRRFAASATIDVEPFDLGRSVRDAFGFADAAARPLAVAVAAPYQLLAVRRIGSLVISCVERGLVVVEKYRRPFFGHRTSNVCADAAIESLTQITLASELLVGAIPKGSARE